MYSLFYIQTGVSFKVYFKITLYKIYRSTYYKSTELQYHKTLICIGERQLQSEFFCKLLIGIYLKSPCIEFIAAVQNDSVM